MQGLMSSEILVQVDNLYRHFGNTRAVDDVSFSLRQGEVLGFLGPNGAGKSTTMQMITGNLAPDAGSIQIYGVDLLDDPRSSKRQIGYLPEQPPVYRELTVDEYLRYCAKLHRVPRKECAGAVDRAKQRCGLQDVGRRLIGNLSKGYQQRAGIAQAILHRPTVVVLDEPTVGLDPIQIREIRELIRELGREHGVILSTHVLHEVQATCSHVQIIHNGCLVHASSLADLNRRQHSTTLLVEFSDPPSADVLVGLPSISRAEPLGVGRFRLYHDGDAAVAPAVARRACTEHWNLRVLTPERTSLEQVFIDLTLGHLGPESAE
jgi:ABC-2 type transport system ATP-binding protein